MGACGFAGRHFLDFILSNNLVGRNSLLGVDLIAEGPAGAGYLQTDLALPGQLEKVLCDFKPEYILNFVGILNNPEVQKVIEVYPV